MIPAAGSLGVTLTRADGALGIDIARPSPVPVGRLFRGRPAEEVARLVPLVFNVCGAAQAAAVRSALDLPQPAGIDGLVAREALREHVVKLCVVWPGLMGEPAGAGDGRAALPLVARALEDAEAARLLRAEVFGAPATAPADWSALADWMAAGETAPARAFAAVARNYDASWGRADVPLYDAAAPVEWETATQGGQAVENAPAMRHPGARLLDDIAERRGHGLLWRMAARLVEVAALLDGRAFPALAAKGVANAARGAMTVDAEAGFAGLSRFRRLSPTDFALAEGGVLATALGTLPAEPDAPLRAVARMVIETVDPCVETALEVADA